MEFKDYYKIMDIAPTATQEEIKKVYRKLTRKHHPDLNPNNKEAEIRFKEISEANEVLSDPESRKKYDEFGKDWKHADAINAEKGRQQQSQRSSGQHQQRGQNEEDFADFFGSMFGGTGRQRSQPKFRGQDVNAALQLNLTDVYTTQKQTITVNGKAIRLTFPAGVENGQVIKIGGHGLPGANGGPSGDLYITVSIKNDTAFKRDGNNLYTDVALDLYTALLGGDMVVDTFDGKVKLKVAAGMQPGRTIKLKGKGFPVYKKEGQSGDLYMTYQVKLPTALSEEEKDLFSKLQKLHAHEKA
jgi:curved DNA-binding protein